MKERILLIEDDEKLGSQVAAQLRTAGFEVNWLREGRLIMPDEAKQYGLVILDLMLPGTYGMDILKALRGGSEVPVLMLSARVDPADKVRALKLGADDYITKPFWPEELLERVRARLRRPGFKRGALFEAGSLRIDFAAREVRVEGRPIDVTKLEFELLAALAHRAGEAVPRLSLAEVSEQHGGEGNPRTLDVHFSRLRKKLGTAVRLETVWGIGYRLAVGV